MKNSALLYNIKRNMCELLRLQCEFELNKINFITCDNKEAFAQYEKIRQNFNDYIRNEEHHVWNDYTTLPEDWEDIQFGDCEYFYYLCRQLDKFKQDYNL